MHIFDKAGLLDYVARHRDLFDAEATRNPFACSAWMLHFIQEVARDDWRFIVPESACAGASAMLLYSSPAQSGHLQAIANYYTSLYSPIISASSDRCGTIADLVGQLPRWWPAFSTLTLAPLELESPDLPALREAFSSAGWYARQYSCFGNWYLPSDGLSFASYMSQRPSQMRNTWSRKAKRFDGAEARLEIITDRTRLDNGMEAYKQVFAKSWKKPEPYPGFIPGWAAVCADNGWLRLGIAWVGDVPIAVQFWFTMHRRASIFKLAYDDAYAKWSAGTVLTAHMMENALDHDRVVEIDYLTGDDTYKQSWMTKRRERVGLRACNLRNAKGIAAAVAERAGDLRKRWRQPLVATREVET